MEGSRGYSYTPRCRSARSAEKLELVLDCFVQYGKANGVASWALQVAK